ncbi:hypothetical protein HK104_002582 [Borealophlyctis nickersoniae]|nr:hypothetical protein HK104_002582 [Borealophlyctis nickersoniae]
MTPIQDVHKAFLNFMKFNHPEEKVQWEDGDHCTFKALSYEILTVNVCRSCGAKAKGGKTKCCPEYDGKANRSKKVYVCDLEIVNEALPYKETPMGKKVVIDGSFEYV